MPRASKPPRHDPTKSAQPVADQLLREKLRDVGRKGGQATARSPAGKDGEVAIIAVERLYPLPAKDLAKQLKRYEGAEQLRWVQDEPANQGAWPFMALNFQQRLTEVEPGRSWQLTKVTRPESSAPSVGSASVHLQQQRALMEAALA